MRSMSHTAAQRRACPCRSRCACYYRGPHAIDAGKVCLACGANVHRLLPVSESCCPLRVSARFLRLHYVNVQTSAHTMTTICRYARQHACTPRKAGCPASQQYSKLSLEPGGEERRKKSMETKGAWEEEQLKLFFFSVCFPHFPALADVTVKS